MKSLLLVFAWALTSLAAEAKSFEKGFVRIRPDQRLYVEYREARAGRPTLVLLNGLTWKTLDWQPFVRELDRLDPDVGLILYDPEGMGRTLLDKAPITFDITIENQVRDLHDLLRVLRVGPVTAVGLSYGGGLAIAAADAHPEDFDQVIAMAPFLHRLSDQDEYIRGMIKQHRAVHPLDPRTDRELYFEYLRVLIYTTYYIPEPSMLENPFKNEAVYRMVKGIIDWQAVDHIHRLGSRRFHLMGAKEDLYVKDLELQGLWQNVPEKSRASYVRLKNTTHKIPSVQPEFSACWVKRILDRDPQLFSGLIFEADPTKVADSKNSKEEACGASL